MVSAGRIELLKVLGNEPAVDADGLAVEKDGAAAVLGALNLHEVPVDLRAIAVVGLVVGVAGGQMEAAGDLLVEEDVAHWVQHPGIAADRPLADVAGPLVGIEDRPELFSVSPRAIGLDDPALGEFEPDAVEERSLIDRRCVEANVALRRSRGPVR